MIQYLITLCDQSSISKGENAFDPHHQTHLNPKVITSTPTADEVIIENQQNGAIIVDVNSDINLTCISSQWQPFNFQVNQWEFEDLDGSVDSVRDIVINGTFNQIKGLDEQQQDINKMLQIFKQRTNDLIDIISST